MEAVLARLNEAGGHVRAEGGRLLAGPASAITPELAALIREHKTALLAAAAGLEGRLLALLAAGPVPWSWVAWKLEADYGEVFELVGRLLTNRVVCLLPGMREPGAKREPEDRLALRPREDV